MNQSVIIKRPTKLRFVAQTTSGIRKEYHFSKLPSGDHYWIVFEQFCRHLGWKGDSFVVGDLNKKGNEKVFVNVSNVMKTCG
jgi:hypothetical protein